MGPASRIRIIDGTVGAGGHAEGILEHTAPGDELLGLDRDPVALPLAQQRLARFGERAHLTHGSFREIERHASSIGWERVNGVLLDLGVSSMQIATPERGFSFRLEGPLDMRFDPEQRETAEDLVNGLPESELRDLIFRYGEETQSRRIARSIVENRPIRNTLELAEVVTDAAKRPSGRERRSKVHPATRTFQALRIAVNDELAALEQALPKCVQLLHSGGRIVVIAFHSLEDRIVKRYFREASRDRSDPLEKSVYGGGEQAQLRLLNRRPIRPQAEEIERNPRARSARLRAAERL